MLVGFALVFVIRPLSGMLALGIGRAEDRVGDEHLNRRERRCTAFFGVRGVGSLYYLAYATSQADFGDHAQLWAVGGVHDHAVGGRARHHRDAGDEVARPGPRGRPRLSRRPR